MAYSYGLYISPITLTDLTVTIEYDNQELPSQTLTLNDFSVDGDELYAGIRVLSDCSMTIESQGYQTQTYNIVIANIESEMHITLTPVIKYFSKISDGTNTYFVKDTEAREKAEIFIASYNTTEFNDILSAYQNGKNVILVWDGAIFPLSRISNTFAEFGSIYNHNTNAKFLDFVTCDNQNVWTRDLMSVLDRSLSNLDATGQAVIDGKVSKSGDTMTGSLNIDTNSLALILPTDERRYEDSGYFQDIQYQYNNIRTGVIRSIASDDGKREIMLGVMDTTGSYKASLALVRESDNTLYARCPTPADNQNNTKIVTGEYLKKHVDGQWVTSGTTLLDGVSINNTNRSISINSVLPNDGRIYEVLFSASGRTGSASGNYLIFYLNGGVLGGTEVCRCITRSASYQTCGGSVIIPCRHGTNISLNVTSNAAVTNITLIARMYRRVGINT